MKSAFVILVLAVLLAAIVAAASSVPRIELVITDTHQAFDIMIKDNAPKATYGNAIEPDLRVKMTSETFAAIFNSPDPKKELMRQYSEGHIDVDLFADEKTLALKGYMGLYKAFQRELGKNQ